MKVPEFYESGTLILERFYYEWSCRLDRIYGESFDSVYMFQTEILGRLVLVFLNNTSNVNSGPMITNVQDINELGDASGVTGEGDTNRKVYTNPSYICSGRAIEKLPLEN